MKLQLSLCVCALFLALTLPAVASDRDCTTLHVSTSGSDDQPGTAAAPLRTVKAALKQAMETEGPVRVAIEPGTYREGGLRLGRRDAATVIESAGSEPAVISGSDVWTDWESRGETLVAAWPHDWENYELGPLFPQRDHDAFRPAGQRSEMVFVDGELLTQVMEAEEMGPGTFRVDLDADELIVQLPEGVSPESALIEVGMRPNLFTMLKVQDVTLRGLTFQHAVNHPNRPDDGFAEYSVSIFGEHVSGMRHAESNPDRTLAERILIEDCAFVFNNRTGLTVANTQDLIIRGSRFDDNGITGIGANRCRRVVIEDCTLDRNNWRLGKLGYVIGWGPAGTKMLFMKDLSFTRCSISHNYASGLWMDTSVNHLTVDDCIMEGNWGTGFYYEHNQGPALFKNSIVRGNGYNDGTREIRIADGGVLYAESENLTIENCVIVDNINFQIASRDRDRPGVGYWGGPEIDGTCRNFVLRDSVVMGSYFDGENVPEFYVPSEHRISTLVGRHAHAKEELYIKGFFATYQGSGNHFYNPHTREVFSTGPNWGYDRVDLEQWQKLTGQDLDSTWGPRD